MIFQEQNSSHGNPHFLSPNEIWLYSILSAALRVLWFSTICAIFFGVFIYPIALRHIEGILIRIRFAVVALDGRCIIFITRQDARIAIHFDMHQVAASHIYIGEMEKDRVEFRSDEIYRLRECSLTTGKLRRSSRLQVNPQAAAVNSCFLCCFSLDSNKALECYLKALRKFRTSS